MDGLTIDHINRSIAEGFPGARARCIEIGERHAVAEMRVGDADIRPGGFVSGPTQFAILDTAFWFASFVAIGRVEPMALTSELSVRFLRPAQGEIVRCRADIEAAGRRNVVSSGRVWMDDHVDRITATAQGTYALPLPT